MKTKLALTVILTSFLLLTGCSNNDDSVQESEALSKSSSNSGGSSEIHREYPKEQKEVMETFGAIAESIILGAGYGYDGEYMDQLISFHDYEGYTFTEFNYDINGVGHSYTAEENEVNERTLFGTIVDQGGVQKFAAVPGTLKVAVYYGNVANLTFISDFELWIDGKLLKVNNLITLLFVKTDGEWKMVHEHHSPTNMVNKGGDDKSASTSKASLSKNSVTNQTYSQAQTEVLETFGAIAESITLGAGHGYDGEYMDQLISYHAYGPKFVEFNNGLVYDSAGNEHNERQLFGEDLEVGGVTKFGFIDGTLKVAVYYGNVANLTFVSDFDLIHKVHGEITVNNLITLLFVKVKGDWKMVHEHHSPLAI